MRILEIMELPNSSNLLFEAAGPGDPWFKLLRNLESIFTKAIPDAKGEIYQLTWKGKPIEGIPGITKENINLIRQAIANNDLSSLSRLPKNLLKDIVNTIPEFSSLATSSLDEVAKDLGETIPMMMKRLAKEYYQSNERLSGLDVIDYLKQRSAQFKLQDLAKDPGGQSQSLDDTVIDFVENFLREQIKKYAPEVEVAGRTIGISTQSSNQMVNSLTRIVNAIVPFQFRSAFFKIIPWIKETLPDLIFRTKLTKFLKPKLKTIDEALEKQVQEIMRKEQEISKPIYDESGNIVGGGRAAELNIMENLDNIWAIIGRAKKTVLSDSEIKQYIREWILENESIPQKYKDEFLKNPATQEFIRDGANYTKSVLKRMTSIYIKAHLKKLPFISQLVQLVERKAIEPGKTVPKIDWTDWFDRLSRDVIYKTPLSREEMMELSMKTSKWGAVAEWAFIYLIYETIISALLENYVAAFIRNYFYAPDFNKTLEQYRQWCKAGLMQDKNNPTKMVDPSECDKLLKKVQTTTWDEYVKLFKINNPWENYVKDIEEVWVTKYPGWSGPIKKLFALVFEATIDPLTKLDELGEFLKIGISPDTLMEKFNLSKEKYLQEYNKQLDPIKQQLSQRGIDVENTKELETAMRNDISTAYKKDPRLQYVTGNFKENLEDFKKFLKRPPNTFSDTQLVNAVEKTDEKGDKYYLIDGKEPIDPADNPKFIFFNGTFTQKEE